MGLHEDQARLAKAREGAGVSRPRRICWTGSRRTIAGLGVDWPANRYLLIGLSGDADVKGRKPMQTGVVNGWHCRYDLQTGKLDVPALFSHDNAKALVPD